MASKSTFLGLAAGAAAGLVVGAAVGLTVKGMTGRKMPMMKRVSKALSGMSDALNNLSKFSG